MLLQPIHTPAQLRLQKMGLVGVSALATLTLSFGMENHKFVHMANKFLQLQHSHYQLTSVQCDCLFGCCPITSQWPALHTHDVKLHNLQSGVTYVRSRVDSRKTWEVSREWRRGRRRMAWNLSHNAPITSTPLNSTFERHDHPGGRRHGIRWPWFLPL